MRKLLCAVLLVGLLSGCAWSDSADLVVYGKIFTAEDNQVVEAFAVKDGKYVYVGDRKGAEAFVENSKTEVLDYTDKGLVMPGCGNGHAHYMLGYALQTVGTMVEMDTDPQKFMTEILPAAVKRARENGSKVVFGQGKTVQKSSSAKAGALRASSPISRPARKLTPFAVTFPFTSWTMNATRP